MRCLNSGCVDYTETRNNYCGRYADVTECDEMEPRNLAKPNAQPALDVVAIKAVDFNHLLVQLDTMSILVREDNFRADNRATFERMIKALQKELSKYESNDV